ncbi:hypothetical protein BGZ61DRAFT_115840 [Ilyonectria robusta]|uniref:uncharacterized protein n=1 Tax=Ilyonectria robusta TaxID=1079257 RepID=UPI001E8E25CF|nr:uncharacterized protein BGZ61DRAFT_115840 [Ilyonectria robusta]KAH8669265.1 hypothetical protein BGZ61DRAFT_115840 [Ilyonectria robusta]
MRCSSRKCRLGFPGHLLPPKSRNKPLTEMNAPVPAAGESMNPSIDSAAFLSQPATTSRRQGSGHVAIRSIGSVYGYPSLATNYNYLIPEIPGVLENQSPSVAPSCAIPICPSDSQNPYGFTGPGSLVPEDPEGLPGWSTREYGIL